MNDMTPFPLPVASDIGGATIQTVNARDLHEALGVGKDFSNWVKDRIGQYDFAENVDFVVYANSGENPNGGRPAREYAISLDMAKELCMVERNDAGRAARRYYIECEKQAKAAMAPLGSPLVGIDPIDGFARNVLFGAAQDVRNMGVN